MPQSNSRTIQASIEVHQLSSPLIRSFREEDITTPISKTPTHAPTVAENFDKIDEVSSHSIDEFDNLTQKS